MDLSNAGESNELTSLRAEVGLLRARLAEVEAERDQFAQENAELFVLQQVFSTINSTLEIDDILGTVLRGILQALDFRRVVLFEVRDAAVIRRLETAEDGTVVASADPAALRDTASLRSLVGGALEFAIGTYDDDESPLQDLDGCYCMLPLTSRETVRGVLYVDRPPPFTVQESELRILLDFAAQAAIAMENARLYGETKRLLDETERLAQTDPLTGLANRRSLTDLMDRILENAGRYGAPLAFLVLDLDDLKVINDRAGHRAGDDALRTFAQTLQSVARRGDVVARYGGDEFVLVMVRGDRSAAEALLGRLLPSFRRVGLSCSAGVALFPAHGSDMAALFEAADRALYEAKTAGKDRFSFAAETG